MDCNSATPEGIPQFPPVSAFWQCPVWALEGWFEGVLSDWELAKWRFKRSEPPSGLFVWSLDYKRPLRGILAQIRVVSGPLYFRAVHPNVERWAYRYGGEFNKECATQHPRVRVAQSEALARLIARA